MTKEKKARVVNPRFAKSKEYRQVIDSIDKIGHCPFCPENFKYHKKPILKKMKGWILTENSWPYKNAEKHFLLIAIKHKETLSDLSAEDFDAILRLSRWAVRTYKIQGGALALRFGETNFTGATVSHLHAHLIYPSLQKSGKSKTVSFPVG
ncbi:MAG: hypothetical protein PHV99_01345 [Candidatus Pacebacteria bacterium]|nr:hypothetical protein [Candidatus Paceibacterota bacterium]